MASGIGTCERKSAQGKEDPKDASPSAKLSLHLGWSCQLESCTPRPQQWRGFRSGATVKWTILLINKNVKQLCYDKESSIYLRRRRNGVVTALQSWQQFAKMIESWLQTWNVLQNMYNIPVSLDDPLLEESFALGTGGRHQFKLFLISGIAAVLGQFFENVRSRVAGDVQVMR